MKVKRHDLWKTFFNYKIFQTFGNLEIDFSFDVQKIFLINDHTFAIMVPFS